jgi:predicted O-methyltransferase YrrM
MSYNNQRSVNFSKKSHNRYWWHRTTGCDYVPLIYQALDREEWDLMELWFQDSEKNYQSTGEAGVPPLSFLIGLITGNAIHRIVQCGHYIGYSSLMLGFHLRKMNKKHAIYSIDIDPNVTTYSKEWIDKAELGDYVRLSVNDSASMHEAVLAEAYLQGPPQLVFIDSSHQYNHTMDELNLWYQRVVPGGFIVLHDTSVFAKCFDVSGSGGVGRAVDEWAVTNKIQKININGFVDGGTPGDYPYLDGCGLTLIQKTI